MNTALKRIIIEVSLNVFQWTNILNARSSTFSDTLRKVNANLWKSQDWLIAWQRRFCREIMKYWWTSCGNAAPTHSYVHDCNCRELFLAFNHQKHCSRTTVLIHYDAKIYKFITHDLQKLIESSLRKTSQVESFLKEKEWLFLSFYYSEIA